jgi:hypothetical protein
VAERVVQNERTTTAQHVARQPDGPGLRIGKRGELTGIGKVTADGARLLRVSTSVVRDIGYGTIESRIGRSFA